MGVQVLNDVRWEYKYLTMSDGSTSIKRCEMGVQVLNDVRWEYKY